jgi:hypothetical protein
MIYVMTIFSRWKNDNSKNIISKTNAWVSVGYSRAH